MNDISKARLRAKYEETVPDDNGCRRWPGKLDSDGYGRFYFEHGQAKAHRAVYELFIGPIRDRYEIDHLCRNRWCIEPDHSDEVLHRLNVLRGEGLAAVNARKTHCKRGHAFTPENTKPGILKNGHKRRDCRTCVRESNRRYKRRLRAAAS